MSFDALTNRGEYLSAHYLEEVLPTTLKKGLLVRWAEAEKRGEPTCRTRLRALRRAYFDRKTELAEFASDDSTSRGDDETHRKVLGELHGDVLTALGFAPTPTTIDVVRAGVEYQVPVAHAEAGVVAIECGWATESDDAADPDGAGRLLEPLTLQAKERIEHGMRLASFLFATEEPPRYVLILNGAVITLADRLAWGEGRYLAVSLDVAFGRNDTRPAGELDVVAALFGADSLQPPDGGGDEPLAQLVDGSRKHAAGVDAELRTGLRLSVEIIANEVLDRMRQAGVLPDQIDEPKALGRRLKQESLRYLYRILFLLYAEARPDLGVLPVDHPEYAEGYSMARLGDLVARPLAGGAARTGFHLYESLDLLFQKVNEGHRPRGIDDSIDEKTSEDEGIRFEPLRSALFQPDSITLIGRHLIEHPDDDSGDTRIDTRLRNECLYRVLRLLMLTKGKKKERGGFISYAQLGISQLGAVYEGLMSYTGFIANEELYEVAKDGDPKDGSWLVPAKLVDTYDDELFVEREDDLTGVKSRVRHPAGSFVYRLAGRDRATSASYYTRASLTQVTVELALAERLDPGGVTTQARELLEWTICEPALGSGSFLNEAINQLAAEYLRRRQRELDVSLDPEEHAHELQKVKAYIALHNCYGVDLNDTAVELAEVSVWLNVMHRGLQAPWFGLHLRRGNSLIGAGRRYYTRDQLADRAWLTETPADHPLSAGTLPQGSIHHFLLPAAGWGAVAGLKEAKALAPEEARRLANWRRTMTREPKMTGKTAKSNQAMRLESLSQRAEWLWNLVRQRLALSEVAVRRYIDVWGADGLPHSGLDHEQRKQLLDDLAEPGTPYWRLKTVMDVWCALWFWPLDAVDQLLGETPDYATVRISAAETGVAETATQYVNDAGAAETGGAFPAVYRTDSLFGDDPAEQLVLPTSPTSPKRTGVSRTARVMLSERRVPLANLDDWLTFAEAVLGTGETPRGTVLEEIASLSALGEFEISLAALLGLREPHQIEDEFPWFMRASQIAKEKAFFHWEIEFAGVEARGGFDLQVGNPPWVRPDWKEPEVLAELNPWFKLSEKPTVESWNQRKVTALAARHARTYFLDELANNCAIAEFLGSSVNYPLLGGTRPDFYRAFMCLVWRNSLPLGCVGMIHPDTHLSGDREGRLREEAYARLRVHGGFVNAGNWAFADAGRTREFGIHIYGSRQSIRFLHVSQLYGPRVLPESLAHDGSGEQPGQKYGGSWDLRPHVSRVVTVDAECLGNWRTVRGDVNSPIEETALLCPITQAEESAIEALANFPSRIGAIDPHVSTGYNEKTAKDNGLIEHRPHAPESLAEVVLQGTHLSIATPFAKRPNNPFRFGKDWIPWDHMQLPENAVPRTLYARACDSLRYEAAQDEWRGKRSAEYFRLAWRAMIDSKSTERSLFSALIPPGPTHVDAVNSMPLEDHRLLGLIAGFWASIPMDYFLRITARSHLRVSDVRLMPMPSGRHPLAEPLLVRTLRLNCMTASYAQLWSDLYSEHWLREGWAVEWPGLGELGPVDSEWSPATPLRSERARRAALVEMDALVALWLGMGVDELLAILRSRYPILMDREFEMWFDKNGRRLAADPYAFGYLQTKEHWRQLKAHLEDPERVRPPEGFTPPFYKADREREMREAHAVFSARLRAAEEAGWRP